MPQIVKTEKFGLTKLAGHCLLSVCLLLGACSSDNDSMAPDDNPINESLINRENQADLIKHIFDLYVGDRYNNPYLDIIGLVSSTTLVNSERPESDVLLSFDCDSGTIEQTLVVSSTNAGNFYTNQFNNCVHAGVLYNGEISGQDGSFRFTFSTDDL